MKIYLNEKEHEVAKGTLLSALPGLCGLPETGIAFAIDDSVVPKKDWESTVLSADDRIIIIKAVCGG